MFAGVVSNMLLYWEGGFVDLFSLTSSPCPSPYSLEHFVLSGVWSASGDFLCVRVRRLGAIGFIWEREEMCEM